MAHQNVEEQLRISQERYRYFVEATAEGFYRLDSERPIPIHLPPSEQVDWMYKYMYVAECNDFVAKMYGYDSAKDVIGHRFVRYHEGEGAAANRLVMEQFVRDSYRLVDEETQEPDDSGNTLHIVNNTIGIVEAEHLVSMWGTARNVTERYKVQKENRELERKMLQTQKLESLGLLAGGIAHDFNNLLTGILGGVSLARLDQHSPAQLQEHLRMIQRSAQRAAGFCNQLQAYAGGGGHIPKPIDLSDAVQEIVSIVSVSIAKQIVLHCDLSPNLPAIISDRNQIQQVILNLITNAAEAIGENPGHIEVRTAIADDASSVYLVVSDDGCGIPAENLQTLYEPFYSTKGASEGRGLGLSAVQGIVRAHNGTIDVQSTPGKGTTFRIDFPPSELRAEARRDNKKKLNWQGSGLALVVDDEKDIRTVARLCLERFGFDVRTAANGEEAHERFLQCPNEYRLALLDLSMPKMNGSELFRELRTIRPDIPIVMSSGFDQTRICDQISPEDNRTSFLQKPYLVADLLEKIQEASA